MINLRFTLSLIILERWNYKDGRQLMMYQIFNLSLVALVWEEMVHRDKISIVWSKKWLTNFSRMIKFFQVEVLRTKASISRCLATYNEFCLMITATCTSRVVQNVKERLRLSILDITDVKIVTRAILNMISVWHTLFLLDFKTQAMLSTSKLLVRLGISLLVLKQATSKIWER
jgi:hypothetical protein